MNIGKSQMEEAVGNSVNRRSCPVDEGHSPRRKGSRFEFFEELNADESMITTGNIMLTCIIS